MDVIKQPHAKKGFTLIETLIYVAFFAMLVGTLLSITYQTISSTDQINKKIAIQQEGNFLLKKIEWVLNDAVSIITPLQNSNGTKLVANKTAFSANPITFDVVGNNIVVQYGTVSEQLNSNNVVINNFNVSRTPVSGKDAIQVTFQISGESFNLTKTLKP